MEQLCSTVRIFIKFDTCVFFENMSRKLMYYENLTRKTGSLHEDQYTFFIISRSVLPSVRNVSDTICRENHNTYFIFNNFFLQILPFIK
jgi:hypothetical protein